MATQVKAGGDIYPARFTTISTVANNTVLESNSGDTKLFGISTEATKNAPQSGGSSLAAEANDEIRVYEPGNTCLLMIGSGGCTAGDFLKPDADGKGVTATTGAVAGAQAIETASASELALVRVVPPLYVA